MSNSNVRAVVTGIICACIALALTASHAEEPEQLVSADLIMINGQVKTGSGWEQAIAIRDGIIVAVGDNDKVKRSLGKDSELIDLDGAAVLPGLHDSHMHALFAGLEQFACGLPPGASPPEIAARLGVCVAESEPGDWILGGNWVAAVFEPGQQDRAFLDRIAPDNPLLLNDEAHHSIWVNSRALEMAGVDRDTPDPPGGIIERNAAGEANGLLRETATDLVERIIPPASMQRRREALVIATNQMLSYGITSFTVASVRMPDMGPLSALSGEGIIKQRVRGCIVWAPEPENVYRSGEMLIAERATYSRPRFKTDCVKIFLDGVPTESHTAAMLAPYADSKDNGADNRPDKGILMMPQDVLTRAVTRFDQQGLHIKFHAAGDGAVRAAIDAVAGARASNGYGGPMHSVGHSTFVDPADIERVRDLQMSWEFSPYIWYPTPIASVDILRAVGEERMQRWIPIKDAVDSGALVVVGSDWSVVPSVNPWLAMETLVTRQKPGGSAETLGIGQAITLESAFAILTENGAQLMGHRDQVGSIDVGMRADIIVTESNPFEIQITDLNALKVSMTFIDGEKVFDASSPPFLKAH